MSSYFQGPVLPKAAPPAPAPPAGAPTRTVQVKAHTRTIPVKKPVPAAKPPAVQPLQNSNAKRWTPNFKGEPPVATPADVFRNPDGSWVKPGTKPQPGAYIAQRKYYTDANTLKMKAGPAGSEATQQNAAQVAATKREQIKNYGESGYLFRSLIPGGLNNGPTSIGTGVLHGVEAASNVLPGGGIGEAAGILSGLKGLKILKGSEVAADAGKAAHVIETAPVVAHVTAPVVAPYVAHGKEFAGSVPDLAREPGYLYHRAPAASLAQIRKTGLMPKKPVGNPAGVYFGNEPLQAHALSQKANSSIYLRVRRGSVPTLTERAFGESFSPNAVPPQDLEYLGGDGKWHPVAQEPAATLRGALPGAKIARGKQEAGYGPQRAARNAKVAAIYADKSLSVSERERQANIALSGTLDKPVYTGMVQLKGAGLDLLKQQIMENPQLSGRGYTQKTLLNSLDKAVNGVVPTRREIMLFEKVFGKNQTAGIVKAAKTGRLKGILEQVVQVPRTIQASLDMSALLRQNLVALGHSPITTLKNTPTLVKAFGSEKAAAASAAKIMADPDYPLLQHMGVQFTGAAGPNHEEQFGAHFLARGKLNPVRWSSRSYSEFNDVQRFDLGKKLLTGLRANPRYNIHDQQLGKDVATIVNSFTGRGPLHFEALERSSKLLNGLFFSPRLMASRFHILLSPANVALAKRNPYLYRQTLKAFVQTFGTLTAVLYAAKRAGVNVGVDPRSSDFGKMKFGNTRVDLAGGFAQFAHLAGEIGYRQKTSSTTGKTTNLWNPKFGQPSLFDVLTEFLTSKASPPLALGIDVTKGQTGFSKFNPAQEAYQRLTPLSAQDVVSVAQDRSKGPLGIGETLGAGLLSTFGAGLQTYGPKQPKPRKSSSTSDNPFTSSNSGGSDYFSGSGSSGGSDYFK